MTIEETENRIKEAGGNIETFWRWMRGQTCGLNPDGTTDIYDCDVERFIRYKCNPANEPIVEWD